MRVAFRRRRRLVRRATGFRRRRRLVRVAVLTRRRRRFLRVAATGLFLLFLRLGFIAPSVTTRAGLERRVRRLRLTRLGAETLRATGLRLRFRLSAAFCARVPKIRICLGDILRRRLVALRRLTFTRLRGLARRLTRIRVAIRSPLPFLPTKQKGLPDVGDFSLSSSSPF